MKFCYLTRPNPEAMVASLKLLQLFGCVESNTGKITDRGMLFSELEMDPRLSVVLCEAYERFGLVEMPCRVAAVLAETGSGSLFYFGGKANREQANRNIGEQASHFTSDIVFYESGMLFSYNIYDVECLLSS